MGLTYAGNPEVSSSFHGMKMFAINIFSMIIFLAYPVTSPVSSFVLDKFGLINSFFPAVLLNVLGAFIRCVASFSPSPKTGYSVAMFGQVLTALGQPFLLLSTETMVNAWLPPTSRASANIIANIIGSAVTLLIVPVLLTYKMNNKLIIFLIVAAFISLPLTRLPSILKTVPSCTVTVPSISLRQGFFDLVQNANFMRLNALFSTIIAIGNSFVCLSIHMLLPYGYSESEGSLAGGVMVFAGITGALVFGFLIDRYHSHVLILKINMGLVACFLAGFVIFLQPASLRAIYCTLGLFGFFGIGLLPISLELGVDCSLPVDPSLSTGIFWLCSNFLTAIVFFTVVGLSGVGYKAGVIFMLVIAIICFSLTLLLNTSKKGQQNDMKYERRRNSAPKTLNGGRLETRISHLKEDKSWCDINEETRRHSHIL